MSCYGALSDQIDGNQREGAYPLSKTHLIERVFEIEERSDNDASPGFWFWRTGVFVFLGDVNGELRPITCEDVPRLWKTSSIGRLSLNSHRHQGLITAVRMSTLPPCQFTKMTL